MANSTAADIWVCWHCYHGLHVNHRGNLHWAERARLEAEERRKWGWLLLSQRPIWTGWTDRNPPPYRLIMEIRYRDRRNRDSDGVLSALKPLVDALTPMRVAHRKGKEVVSGGVGVLPGDSNAIIQATTIRLVPASPENGTWITVWPISLDEIERVLK